MKALKKAQIAERTEMAATLREKREALDAAVEAFNTALDEAWGKVEEALGEYNEALEPAREWVAGITGDIDTYTSERSDKWQESDRAAAYEQWKAEYEGVDLDDVSLDKPDELELDAEDHADLLDDLPEEVE